VQERRKYLAFDVETATLPDWGHNRSRRHRLGITCAATLASDEPSPRLWYARADDGRPADRMQQADARQLVDYLAGKAAEGYTPLTWNGLEFDFQVLAEESGALEECRRIAWNHVDLMFHVFCVQGYRIALTKAAQGMGIRGKPEGMSGIMAPGLWAEGRRPEVLDYVCQDVRIPMELARTCTDRGEFCWITSGGRLKRMPLRRGWLPVHEALALDEPDTSWMSSPTPRCEFTNWLGALPPP
jgi:hypothetical protein